MTYYEIKLAFASMFTCAARRGRLCCWRLADGGQPLRDGTQVGVLGGVRPRAVQGAVHVLVPPACGSGGHLWTDRLQC